jgi:hypothetical protein
MRIPVTKPLFAWDCLEDSPSLRTIQEFLDAVPDARLIASLRRWRGRGRDDYKVWVLWRTLLVTILLRHPGPKWCLDELRRNPSLRRVVGIEREDQVPKEWNMSRFLQVLGREPHRSLLREVFDAMVRMLGEEVADLGRDTAGDATGLSARRLRSVLKAARAEDGLPPPEGGRKEYTDEAGNVTHVVAWFGYKLHLLVDVRHEVALGYRVSSPKRGDNEELPGVVAQARANLPADRMRTLTYDRAADDGAVHRCLDEAGIRPVIRNRALWQGESERMLPGHDGRSNIVYDESGTVHCYDKVSREPVRHRMAYIGHEPARRTLKYRCPSMHERWQPRCPSHERCNAGKRYGLTVRVKRDVDLRRFPPIPRATKQFERLYKGLSAVERANARLKVFWGADDGNITGACRFHAYVGAVMVVHAGLALLLASMPRREGTLGRMRLSPIAKALRGKWEARARGQPD